MGAMAAEDYERPDDDAGEELLKWKYMLHKLSHC
jgi:hypothetical protein